MPMQQALAPEDLSAMRLLPVPDVWPPGDCAPVATLEGQWPAGIAAHGCDQSGEQADDDHAWLRQFAVLLAEALTGVRPVRQIRPWLSQRGSVHLYRLLPLFGGGQGARLQRVLTTQPSPDVIEMTLIVAIGPRIRALAVRLTLAEPTQRSQWQGKPPTRTAEPRSAESRSSTPARWLCTDIEAA
jgi:hypothetical protein